MNKNRQSGFTLVELIVVIAILGILAGVGTVAYTGYVEKANKAVDEQLIADIKYAGALGEYENPGATGNVMVYKADRDAVVSGTNQTEVTKWIEDVFGENWADTMRLKYYEQFLVSFPGGTTLAVDSETIAHATAFKESNFGENPEVLAETVTFLSTQLGGWLTGEGNDLSSYFPEGEYDNFVKTYGLTDSSSSTAVSNAVVKYIASVTAGMDTSNLSYDYLAENYGILPATAMVYAVMTGYANSGSDGANTFKTRLDNMNNDLSTTEGGQIGVIKNLFGSLDPSTDNDFRTYLVGTDGTDGEYLKDIAGYKSALTVLNNAESNFNINDANAFSNDATLALMNAILAQANSSN